MKRFFITGTSTDIGKTFISSILFNNLKDACYYKPVQSGCEEIEDRIFIPDLEFLKSNSKIKEKERFICAYPLKFPLSPHLSSRKTNIEININKIKNLYENLKIKFKNIIVEGAGGIFTPLNENYFIINLIKDLNLSAVVVTNLEVGTINQTLMTINHLKNYEIKIKGIVFNKFKNSKDEEENIIFIKNYTKIENVLIIPNLENPANANKIEVREFIEDI